MPSLPTPTANYTDFMRGEPAAHYQVCAGAHLCACSASWAFASAGHHRPRRRGKARDDESNSVSLMACALYDSGGPVPRLLHNHDTRIPAEGTFLSPRI